MRIYIIAALLLPSIFLFAQQESYCGTGIDAENEKFLTEFFAGSHPIKSTTAIMWVPVTAHIVAPVGGTAPYTERNVLEALCTLNEDFATTNIQYYLSSFKFIYNDSYYDHDYQNGIQMMQLNNVFGTANAYFVDSPAGNCGYFAGAGGAVALAFSCTKKNDHTWAHEMGHYLSLPHTFRGWEGDDYEVGEVAPNFINNRKVEKAVDDPDCGIASDRFCDTPADYLSYRWNCNNDNESSELQLDPDSISFRSDGTFIMSYSNDACVDKFSPMQIEAMVSNLQNTKSEQIDDEYISPSLLDKENTIPLYPINDVTVTESSTNLMWEEAGEAKYYYLEVSKFPQFQFPIAQNWVTGTDFTLDDLQDGKTYYWRITSFDDSGYCAEKGETNSFETSFIVANEEDFYNNAVSLYPNPTNGNFFIRADKPFSGEISIYNSQLEWIDTRDINQASKIEYNQELIPGMYIIQLFDGKKKITKKLIVQ